MHADLEVAGHQGQEIFDRGGGLGLGEMQGLAPGGEAALVLFGSQFGAEVEFGDDLREDGFALEDIDLGLEVGFERVRAAFIGGRAHIAHVEEVLIEVLDLKGGAGLVDGRLGKREQERGEEAEAGDEDERAFTTAEHVPVLEQQAGALVVHDITGGGAPCSGGRAAPDLIRSP